MHPTQAVMEALRPTSTGRHGLDPTSTLPPIPVEYQQADDAGFGALWIVFVIMLAASGVFTVMSWNVPISRRLYHVITTLITVTAALSYFSMATGHATANHCVEQVYSRRDKEHPGETVEVCREVYWARYVDWALTTPLLLLDLCLLAGIDGAHTLMAVIADVIMILTGLFAAFGNDETGTQKWGWYTIACAAYLVVIWHVSIHGQRMVRAKGANTIKLFSSLAVFTFILWTAYPIVWGIADGSRKASVDQEIFAYAVLDVLAKPVFGMWLLLSHRRIPETNVDVDGYWSSGPTAEGRIRIGEERDGA